MTDPQSERSDEKIADTTAPIERSAEDMICVIAGQLTTLETIALTLENTLMAETCDCAPISTDAMHRYQRLDYMRQSLKDMNAILTLIAPRLEWRDGGAPSHASLRAVIDMQGSLEGTSPFMDLAENDDDILL